MHIQLLGLFIEVVKSGTTWSENVVRLEADYIMKESSELVNLTLHLDVWSRVFLEEGVVLMDLHFQLAQLYAELFYYLLLLQNVKKLALGQVLSHLLNH